ncbi:flagellar filament capping protein FliD [Ferviditalea candida]|uniref:Flagellar hook-associated protein 2 n=1 Tax=Ferviditalea candida TaxID=3108399 RepID=A0ABU5ZM48_9BACL|nr:flagellar filament capping protein FliD [Paenibacillaceae bacterium T2]
MVMRISGIGSGLDIDSMVSKLMQAERAPLNKLTQKQQKLTWKEQAYRDINLKLSAFRDSLFSLRFQSNWAKTTSTSSDTSKVEVTSVGTASTGTHNIVVSNLATGAYTSSTNVVTATASLEGTASVASGANILATSNNNKFNLTLNGVTKTITVADGNYADNVSFGAAVQSAVDQAFGANQIKVDTSSGLLSFQPQGDPNYLPQLTITAVAGNSFIADMGFTDGQSFKLNSAATLSSQSSKLSAAVTGTYFTINGQRISYDPAVDSLNSIISKVNSSAAGVNMSYDSITDKITFTSKSTGDTAQINLGAGDGNFLTTFNLDNSAVTQGHNANVTIDGTAASYATNQFTSNGVTYTLHNTTDAAGVNINVTQDTDSIYNQIVDFVNKYNDLLGVLNSKISEPTYRDYQPLTDDQKKAMSETDITNWEAKAKSGLLANDTYLRQMRDNLRQIAYSTVGTLPTDSNSLYKIGITTQSYVLGNSTDAGKLVIDNDALKTAISQNPEGVIQLFTNQPSSGNQNEKGILQQMYESSNDSISSIMKVAGSSNLAYDSASYTLGLQVRNLNSQISLLQDKLTAKEDYYYQMFSKMDTAISNANNQISWLQSQMSG